MPLSPLPAVHVSSDRASRPVLFGFGLRSLCSSSSNGSVSSSEERQPAPTDVRQSRAYRIRLPLTAACLLTGLCITHFSRPLVTLRSPSGMWLTAGGFVLLVAGIAVRLWALASISERKTRQLVTTGPYSVCRNPLYVGTLLIVGAFVVFWQSLAIGLLLMPVIALYRFGVVPAEERVLAGIYGAEFDAYCRRTPRWFPRLGGYVPEDKLAIRSVGVIREAQCGLWWLAFAGLSLWITAARAAGLGHIF